MTMMRNNSPSRNNHDYLDDEIRDLLDESPAVSPAGSPSNRKSKRSLTRSGKSFFNELEMQEAGSAFLPHPDLESQGLNPPERDRKKYFLGIICVLSVAVIWTFGTVVKQIVFGQLNFNHPFFFVYFSNSCYTLHLPILLCAKKVFHSNPPPTLDMPSTIKLGMMIAPLWLLGQWSYAYGVSLTTATVSTVISTTSCVWTYLLAVLFLNERPTLGHVVGISLCVMGNIFTCFEKHPSEIIPDQTHSNDIANSLDFSTSGGVTGWSTSPLFGKFLCVFSSLVYAIYTTVISLKVKDENYWQIGTLFASIGVGTFLFGLPVMYFGGDSMGLSDFTGMLPLIMFVNGLFDNVLSQYLWCLGVLLTSSTVATVGLSLCIPLAMVADVFRGLHVGKWVMLASVCVIFGFTKLATMTSDRPPSRTELRRHMS